MKTAVIGLFLTACSSGEEQVRTGSGKEVPILLTTSVQPALRTETRAGYMADYYSNSLPVGSLIDVLIYNASNNAAITTELTDPTQPWIYRTLDEADPTTGRSTLLLTNATKAPHFPNGVNDVNIFAVYPQVAGLTPSTGSFQFSVNTNQTTESAIIGGDLLTSELTSMNINDGAVNLELYHRMAKVLVEFVPSNDLAAENMPNTTYSVTNVKTGVTVTPTTGGVATNAATTTVTAKVGEPFFLPPQTITAGTQLLQFDLKNVGATGTGIRNVTFSPTTDIVLEGNIFYVLQLTVGVNYIKLTTTIKDWTGETVLFDKIIL